MTTEMVEEYRQASLGSQGSPPARGAITLPSVIITKSTVYVSRALYIIFETTPDAGSIIIDTSGMWKLMPRKFMYPGPQARK